MDFSHWSKADSAPVSSPGLGDAQDLESHHQPLMPEAGALQPVEVGTLTESLIREIGPTGSPSLDLLEG